MTLILYCVIFYDTIWSVFVVCKKLMWGFCQLRHSHPRQPITLWGGGGDYGHPSPCPPKSPHPAKQHFSHNNKYILQGNRLSNQTSVLEITSRYPPQNIPANLFVYSNKFNANSTNAQQYFHFNISTLSQGIFTRNHFSFTPITQSETETRVHSLGWTLLNSVYPRKHGARNGIF